MIILCVKTHLCLEHDDGLLCSSTLLVYAHLESSYLNGNLAFHSIGALGHFLLRKITSNAKGTAFLVWLVNVSQRVIL